MSTAAKVGTTLKVARKEKGRERGSAGAKAKVKAAEKERAMEKAKAPEAEKGRAAFILGLSLIGPSRHGRSNPTPKTTTREMRALHTSVKPATKASQLRQL